MKPRARVRPVAVRRGHGYAEGLGRLVDGQPGEVTQLDEVGFDWVLGSESIEGVVQRQEWPWGPAVATGYDAADADAAAGSADVFQRDPRLQNGNDLCQGGEPGGHRCGALAVVAINIA